MILRQVALGKGSLSCAHEGATRHVEWWCLLAAGSRREIGAACLPHTSWRFKRWTQRQLERRFKDAKDVILRKNVRLS